MEIKEVILFTSNLQKQKEFYKTVLEFELIEDSLELISFKTGSSVLSFQNKEQSNSYHLAFNIPSNAINDALNWLQKRVKILDFEGALISDFSSWKAKAVYFYDADHNIIEFIARERIEVESDVNFSAHSIVSISEMAMATTHIESLYNHINSIRPISIFDGNFSRFCAIGNDEGLFILVNKDKKKWYPTNEDVLSSDFIIKGNYNFAFINGKIEELS